MHVVYGFKVRNSVFSLYIREDFNRSLHICGGTLCRSLHEGGLLSQWTSVISTTNYDLNCLD